MKIIWALLFVSCTAFAEAVPPSVLEAQAGYHLVLRQCPERIWPGVDWSKTQMLMAAPSTRRAWLIHAASSVQPEEITGREVPEVAFHAPFSFQQIRGVLTVTVNIELPWFAAGEAQPFDLATHEMFHRFGQSGWRNPPGSRGTLVPLEAQPRYFRTMILNELRRGYFGDAAAIGRATGWYEAWSKTYPAQLNASTDGYEGSAHYVELRARHLLDGGGCTMSEADLRARQEKWLARAPTDPRMGLDGEGYALGALAGMILDEEAPDEWKLACAKGVTPTQFLASRHAAAAIAQDPAISSDYARIIAETNADLDLWRLPLEARLQDTEFIRVAIPVNWIRGAFSPKGFFVPRANPNRLYIPWAREHEFSDSRGAFIRVQADSVAVTDPEGESACPGLFSYVTVSRADLKNPASDSWEAQKADVSLNIRARRKAVNGFDYLCPF